MPKADPEITALGTKSGLCKAATSATFLSLFRPSPITLPIQPPTPCRSAVAELVTVVDELASLREGNAELRRQLDRHSGWSPPQDGPSTPVDVPVDH